MNGNVGDKTKHEKSSKLKYLPKVLPPFSLAGRVTRAHHVSDATMHNRESCKGGIAPQTY